MMKKDEALEKKTKAIKIDNDMPKETIAQEENIIVRNL